MDDQFCSYPCYICRLPARCLATPCRSSLRLRSSPQSSSLVSSGSAGLPPKLARTILFVAVNSSNICSSLRLNHLGTNKILNGMRMIISTGKPIAASVCDIATQAATTKNCIPIYSMILRLRTSKIGSSRCTKRRSACRKINFCRIPFDSIEPHCASLVRYWPQGRNFYQYVPQQQRILQQIKPMESCG